MFREMLRKKQQITNEECIKILKEEPRGVLTVIGDNGYPYGMPINQYYCEEDGKLYFHGGKKGHKIDALRKTPKASFCICDEGIRDDGNWYLKFRSVIVFGTVEFVEDYDQMIAITRRLCHKFTQDEDYIEDEIRSSAPGTLMFCLTPEHISGKTVTER